MLRKQAAYAQIWQVRKKRRKFDGCKHANWPLWRYIMPFYCYSAHVDKIHNLIGHIRPKYQHVTKLSYVIRVSHNNVFNKFISFSLSSFFGMYFRILLWYFNHAPSVRDDYWFSENFSGSARGTRINAVLRSLLGTRLISVPFQINTRFRCDYLYFNMKQLLWEDHVNIQKGKTNKREDRCSYE